jgi:hypothetical protein
VPGLMGRTSQKEALPDFPCGSRLGREGQTGDSPGGSNMSNNAAGRPRKCADKPAAAGVLSPIIRTALDYFTSAGPVSQIRRSATSRAAKCANKSPDSDGQQQTASHGISSLRSGIQGETANL